MKTIRITPGLYSEIKQAAKKDKISPHKYGVQAIASFLASDGQIPRVVNRTVCYHLDLTCDTERALELISNKDGDVSKTIRYILTDSVRGKK